MKKTISNKLSLGKKTIGKLQAFELGGINGGSSYATFRCPTHSCTPPSWNCPPPSSGNTSHYPQPEPYTGGGSIIQPYWGGGGLLQEQQHLV
jgi:hypothetical protein